MTRLRKVIAEVESAATQAGLHGPGRAARDLALERKLMRAASRPRTAAAAPLAAAFGVVPQWARSDRATSPMPPASSASITIVLKRLVGRK